MQERRDFPGLLREIEFVKIPPAFYSDATGAPFRECISCEKFLLKEGVEYVIEKAIKAYKKFATQDTIFEYAMCLDCYEQIQKSFSRESRQRVDAYMAGRVDFKTRRRRLFQAGEAAADRWLGSCLLRGTPRGELSEYQIYGQCIGEELVIADMPFLLSSEAIDDLIPLLSDKTIGEIGGFMDEFFGLPPDIQKRLPERPLALI